MQKTVINNKATDFISFLKRSWQKNAPSSAKAVSEVDEVFDAEIISAEERAKRFYRSIEEGKLAKVLNTVVSDLEAVTREDRDEVNAQLWKKEKKKSEKEIVKKGEVFKKTREKYPLTFSNPIGYSLFREKNLDIKTGIFTESLSLTWKYSALALVLLFLSVGYVSLFPAKARETVSRLDMLISYPSEKAVSLARDFNLLPALSDKKKFANSLPKSNLSINKNLKSEYIRSMNSGQEIVLFSDGKYIKLTEKDIRGASEQFDQPRAEIAVLGLDSETDTTKENIIIKTVKRFFEKIAVKQEQISIDLNDKLNDLIK
jgi:hypothetical protein